MSLPSDAQVKAGTHHLAKGPHIPLMKTLGVMQMAW